MNLKRLQAFPAVYEAGSVTAAAQRLHMTQSAVSRLISDLEKDRLSRSTKNIARLAAGLRRASGRC
jgi:DNA-binding transcriptional LysR family regulator